MKFRKLREEDASAYWTLRLQAVEQETRSFGATPEEHRRITLDQARELIVKPGALLMGAFDGGAMVGIVRFDREPGIKEHHKGHVRSVYVSASHRDRGVAKGMIGALIDEVKQDPTCEQLLLAVGVFNEPARRAYRALGFVPFGIEPRALRTDDEYIDEEHMILMLRD